MFLLVRVILSLGVPKLVIFSAFIGQKIFVATVLNNAAVIKNYDIVTEAAGGKTVKLPYFLTKFLHLTIYSAIKYILLSVF